MKHNTVNIKTETTLFWKITVKTIYLHIMRQFINNTI